MAGHNARETVLPGKDYNVPRPPPITTDVPTAQNVVAADRSRRNVTTEGSIAAAIRYEVQVPGSSASPPWLQPIIIGLEDRLDALAQRLEGQIQDIKAIAVKTHIAWAKRDNLVFSAGQLVEVPFPDGLFPWNCEVEGPSHDRVKLPPLTSLAVIDGLTAPQSYGYFRGYYPDTAQVPQVAIRKEQIKIAVGLRRDVMAG
ncbi:hypothetical protein L227DRAFT_616096 [Lentinus tigrinus ALCF2SS1-6]|uniref:Mug135-like C-terminal domain-containing protein n=1 Tax=Lentinus tigrinus ALCF2SS1-6 TaxID=1328759 RepID=A0A5C2RWB2_9APHY|nr:hypothetical protein L227DRAFT_616096 [Lentinus tigrinus ALCF2SS1-6]